MTYRIFVEGDYDSAFLKAYLNHLFGQKDEIEIIPTNGWTSLTYLSNSFKENTDQGGINLVIYDADFAHNKGGFDPRLAQINQIKKDKSIEFNLFLFPNHKDDGDLETLLSNIVSADHQPIMDCFNQYEQCLIHHAKANEEIKVNLPLSKTKIYALMETVLDGRVLKIAKTNNHWFFEDSHYWNLNSENLNSLKAFLTDNIK